MISHLVNGFNTYYASTEFFSLNTFLELPLCLTRTEYQDRFCITNTRNNLIIVDVEMSGRVSLAAIICRNFLRSI